MNIILLDSAEIQENNTVFLQGERAEHLVKVLRADVGTRVRVGVLSGLLGSGELLSLRKKYPFTAELQLELTTPPPARPRFDLILALPRPIMLKRIFSQATALGIGRFFLIHSRRVEKSFWESTLLEKEEYQTHLRKGLEQAAVDTRLPEVYQYPRFKPFIEEGFAALAKEYQHCIIAHPQGERLSSLGLAEDGGRVVFAIGPEGGWVDYEVEKFREQGFSCCTMGRRILKVDTAVTALHAQISMLCGEV